MKLASRKDRKNNAMLAAAMRALRTERRMRASELASKMGLPLRTYERLEAGTGPISFDRIVRFCSATDSDPIALLAVLPLKKPELARWCADNKLMTIAMMAIGDLVDELGEDIIYLEPRTLINAYTRAARDLAEGFRNRDTFAETWLQAHSNKPAGDGQAPARPLRWRELG